MRWFSIFFNLSEILHKWFLNYTEYLHLCNNFFGFFFQIKLNKEDKNLRECYLKVFNIFKKTENMYYISLMCYIDFIILFRQFVLTIIFIPFFLEPKGLNSSSKSLISYKFTHLSCYYIFVVAIIQLCLWYIMKNQILRHNCQKFWCVDNVHII